MAAATELLAEKAFDQLSITDIAARAGVSVGGFYARFASKDELLRRLHYGAYVTEMAERAARELDPTRWAGRGAEEIARTYFAMMIDGGARHHVLIRELVQRNRADPAAQSEWDAYDAFVDAVHAPFLALLRERISRSTHPDPELALRVGFSATSSALRETLLFGHMRPSMGSIAPAVLAAELARMLCAYLGIAASGDGDALALGIPLG